MYSLFDVVVFVVLQDHLGATEAAAFGAVLPAAICRYIVPAAALAADAVAAGARFVVL